MDLASAHLCFSIVARTRSLALQAANQSERDRYGFLHVSVVFVDICACFLCAFETYGSVFVFMLVAVLHLYN
jgi:hypothetical protein